MSAESAESRERAERAESRERAVTGAAGPARIAVIGAGTMGHGIAQIAASAGFPVVLTDADPTALGRGRRRIAENLEEGIRRGKVTTEARDETLARVGLEADQAAAVADADFVIEAVVENLEIKKGILERVEAHVRADTVLASNTSSLSITRMAAGLRHPGRVIGMHFFNPVHVMRLVEVVVGRETGDTTRDRVVELATTLGKDAIVVRDTPGFASSRLGVVLGLEAMRMVEQGVASALDIDTAMESGYRHPMGPLRLTDLVGLDVRLSIAETLHSELGGDQYAAPEILRRLVSEGKLGKKTGEGFYRWD